jgi:hypothetical protein
MALGVRARISDTRNPSTGSVPSIGVEGGGHEPSSYLEEGFDGRAWRRGSERPNYGRGAPCCPVGVTPKSVAPVSLTGSHPPAARSDTERRL